MKNTAIFPCLISVLAILVVSGCGTGSNTDYLPKDGRTFGAVMSGDSPVKSGTITFVEKESGQEYSAAIKDGRYEVRVPGGEKLIRITSDQQSIPAKYNTNTTLTRMVPNNGGPLDIEIF